MSLELSEIIGYLHRRMVRGWNDTGNRIPVRLVAMAELKSETLCRIRWTLIQSLEEESSHAKSTGTVPY